jgi:hypothetical protein
MLLAFIVRIFIHHFFCFVAIVIVVYHRRIKNTMICWLIFCMFLVLPSILLALDVFSFLRLLMKSLKLKKWCEGSSSTHRQIHTSSVIPGVFGLEQSLPPPPSSLVKRFDL